MPRKLLSDISVDELLGMRDAGMTNRDIANALDISYASVYRLIGKQPGSLRASNHTADLPPAMPPSAPPTAAPSQEPEAALIVEDRLFRLAGLFASYNVRVKKQEIDVCVDEGSVALTVKFDEIGAFASELAAIERHVAELKVGCEAW